MTTLENSGFEGVTNAAVSNIESILHIRDEIHGADEILDQIVDEGERIIRFLNLARSSVGLQTDDVCAQAVEIMDFSCHLNVSMLVMAAENRSVARIGQPKVIGERDYEYRCLKTMLERFEDIGAELEDLVLGSRVGVEGNVGDGWAINRKVLDHANTQVRNLLGINLVVYDHLKQRLDAETDDWLRLTDAEAALLRLPAAISSRIEDWRRGVMEETAEIVG